MKLSLLLSFFCNLTDGQTRLQKFSLILENHCLVFNMQISGVKVRYSSGKFLNLILGRLVWLSSGLWISSDRDDRMGAKTKTPKNSLGLQTKPKKSLDQNLTSRKSHAKFPSHKNLFTELRGQGVWELLRIFRLFWLPPPPSPQRKFLLKSSYQKNTCQNFSTQKNPSIIHVTWNAECPSDSAAI